MLHATPSLTVAPADTATTAAGHSCSAILPTAATSGFNLNSLRLPQNFGESLGVRKLTLHAPVRKPPKAEFFRARAGEDWRYPTMILELKTEGETYIVSPDLWDTLPELLRPVMLHVAIDRRNNVFVIPIPLPGQDGRRNPWHQSLAEAVAMSEAKWLRIAANMSVGGYDVFVANAKLPEPEWPDLTLEELLKIAFRDRLIDSLKHPVIRQLLGDA